MAPPTHSGAMPIIRSTGGRWWLSRQTGDIGNVRKESITVKDPVCGMEVDPKTAAAKVEYKGQTYYFCSPGCLATFEKNPERYAGAQMSGGHHGMHHLNPPVVAFHESRKSTDICLKEKQRAPHDSQSDEPGDAGVHRQLPELPQYLRRGD